MAALILPSRRVVQPQGPVEIDPSFKLFPIGLYLPTAGRFDASNYLPFSGGSALTLTAGRAGVSALQTANNTGLYRALPSLKSKNEYSAFWHGVPLGAFSGSSPHLVSICNSTTSQTQSIIGIELTTTTQISVRFKSGSTFAVRNASLTWADLAQKQVSFLASYSVDEGFVRLRMCVDGVISTLIDSSIISPAALVLSGTEQFTVGPEVIEQPSRYINAQVALAGVFYGRLGQPAAERILQNPWQLFRPIQRRIWVDVAAGGATDLVTQEATHGHTADSLTLTTATTLAIDDSTHGHTAESPTLTVQSVLAVDDALHGHTADSLTFNTGTSISVDEATHAHTADALILTTDSTLAVDEALHAHTADNLTTTPVTGDTLDVQEATHAHSADALALTTDQLLAVDDATHAHTADNLAVSTQILLSVNEALHAHSADNLVLSDEPSLSIASALHAHAADSIALTSASWLVAQEALHAHQADNLSLSAFDANDELYPLAGQRQTFPIAGQRQTFPIAGQRQTFPLE